MEYQMVTGGNGLRAGGLNLFFLSFLKKIKGKL